MQSIKAVTIDNLFIEKLIWSPVESSPSQLANCAITAIRNPNFQIIVTVRRHVRARQDRGKQQCHKRPKHLSFDFCGKSCAASAIPQRGNTTAGGQRAKGNTSNNQQPAQPAFNPVQVAQFVATQVPHVQALLTALNSAAAPQAAPQPQVVQQPAPTVGPRAPPQNNPFLQTQVQAPAGGLAPIMNGTQAPSSSLLLSTQPPSASGGVPAAVPPECRIPGCGKPVHVDTKGVTTSEYCSLRHCEEAVTSGFAEPCIMCLRMPQSEADYFCSRGCKDEALQKMPE
ncbi:hypothetical protein H0H81_001610 [Sphagnurus paluster]|uniref:Uncharacterized protein n=1 Tax=Sphagnurus paluster TaxID=117069 RepID=A0A9P7GU94_9AGAR|nr:hypothetical protein H0H81_001610 [Sphagnurus paluster]